MVLFCLNGKRGNDGGESIGVVVVDNTEDLLFSFSSFFCVLAASELCKKKLLAGWRNIL
jgi:hypothetical protein